MRHLSENRGLSVTEKMDMVTLSATPLDGEASATT